MKKAAQWTNGIENILGLENELFRKRMVILSSFIDKDDKSIIDFGASAEYLRRVINKDVKYFPVDYVKRSERTILCDLNKGNFPDLKADVAFMAGFLEYMDDIDSVILKTSKSVRKIIVSYKGAEKFKESLLETEQLISIFNKYDFVMTNRDNSFPEDWTLLACFEKINPSLITKNKYCTGCSACANSCSSNAITMNYDNEGFLKPLIDSKACINCNKCVMVCPTLQKKENKNNEKIAYAAWAKDEYRMNSSSGGVFSEFANQIILQGGVVFGAVWTDDFFIKHISVEREEDLWKLRYFKYAQSDVTESFPKVKVFLENNRKVLYVGTPCQIAGLKAYLGTRSEDVNLITIDLLCFCQPSIITFREYLKDTYGIENIKNITFRHKHNGWSAYGYKIELKDGSVIYPTINGYEHDAYQSLFHSTAVRNNVCENCMFSDFPRQADFSIGDFWCVEHTDPSWNDGNGTSLVIINNSKAKKFFENDVISNLKRVQEVTDEWYRNKGNRIGQDGRKGTKYKRFLELKDKYSFKEAVDQVTKDKHDIGLVGMLLPNFGNQLTYYALYKVLTDYGYSTVMINFPEDSNMEKNLDEKWKDKFALFLRNPYPEYDISVHAKNKLDNFWQNWNCKMFVLGSDQVLRSGFVWDMGFHPCMDWVYSNKYKIAYATSFGSDKYEGDDRLRAREGFFLQRFQKISVREASGVDILKTEFGINSTQVLDPVFLLDESEYEKMLRIGQMRLPDEKFTAAYILDPTENRAQMLQALADDFTNGNAIAVSDAYRSKEMGFNWTFPTLEDVKIEEWLAVIKNCEFFITDSFHGACFALIFKKQFAVTFDKTQWRGFARLNSLLKMFDLEDRFIENLDDLRNKEFKRNVIDYNKVDLILNENKALSINWLQTALEERKTFKTNDTVYDVLLDTKNEIYYNLDLKINNLSERINEQQIMNKEIEMNMLKELQENKNAFTDFETKYNNLESNMMNYIQARDATILQQSNRLNELNQELQCLKNSKSFRIGRIITWLPRKIRDYLKR